MKNPNCKTCKHVLSLPGNVHVSCDHPAIENVSLLNFIFSQYKAGRINPLNIKANEIGVFRGWFNWPFDFDPVWLENCNGFEGTE